MVNQQDNRPKFEEMSGFQEIDTKVGEEDFLEKVEKCLMIILETMKELTKDYLIPLTVRFAIIYLVLDLLFYGADIVYAVVRVVFLVVLLVYERR